ncbi:Lrp/AsnC family transcriptional regulator [Shouchella lehensis]|uniref:HTH-type, AsnC family transcriptional regulator n=1 Tax=Shouchella lehensis G1 TaxID=1246626 RepID=A0A060LS27_9BACI|nr:Lrp/AsnC family transcriptional regulator [Shouchella lehensis]AIC92957.1 HTH-type, AsnC family transcriptional regulator [Shouchella lehensis G1]RQW22560.1 Lrp/AsnC family transcriptional regulator [Bacillus sp. C1-1]
MKIDEIDLNILDELKKDSRQSIRELSKKVNLSPPSVSERIKKMEESSIIEGYTLRINEKALGLPVQCLMDITIKNGKYGIFQEKIATYPGISYCYRITGSACFSLKYSTTTLEKIEAFIADFNSVATTITHVILSEVPMNWSYSTFDQEQTFLKQK